MAQAIPAVTVIRPISRGGFGRVDEVEVAGHGRVARKMFDPQISLFEDYSLTPEKLEKLKARFGREVKTQQFLGEKYPDSIMPILFAAHHENPPWFLMPLAEHSLKQYAAKSPGIDALAKALPDVLNALQCLHDLGFTHRDLKPANILFHNGTWKLTDFGLILPPKGKMTTLTSRDSGWGTEAYLSPEQYHDFHSATPRSDIYSFGCILHDIYEGIPRLPYHKHYGKGAVGRVIEKCTEVDPKRRFDDVRNLRGVLLGLLAQPSTPVTGIEGREWIEKLKTPDQFTAEQVSEFVRYLTRPDERDSDPLVNIENLMASWGALEAVDENTLKVLFEKNPTAWKDLALAYCEWAQRGFDFAYCDVVIMRLKTIFEMGSLDVKSAAALAAAELGHSHNRWFVMRRLMEMCGPSIDAQLADRIALDIRIDSREEDFRECAHRIDKTGEDYHPSIAAAIRRHK